jgi:hypothetical protein
MQSAGVQAFPVHIRNDFYTGFKNIVLDSDILDGVEIVSKSMCCIPVGQWLTNNEVAQITDALNTWGGRNEHS